MRTFSVVQQTFKTKQNLVTDEEHLWNVVQGHMPSSTEASSSKDKQGTLNEVIPSSADAIECSDDASNKRKFNRHNEQGIIDSHQYHTCFNIGTAIRKTCKQVLESKAELIPAEQL